MTTLSKVLTAALLLTIAGFFWRYGVTGWWPLAPCLLTLAIMVAAIGASEPGRRRDG
jgi:hypothetical protein